MEQNSTCVREPQFSSESHLLFIKHTHSAAEGDSKLSVFFTDGSCVSRKCPWAGPATLILQIIRVKEGQLAKGDIFLSIQGTKELLNKSMIKTVQSGVLVKIRIHVVF